MTESRPESVVAALEYEQPGAEKSQRSLYPVIMVLGGAPLVIGVSIFLLYWLTRADWLMLAGFFTLLAGVICFLSGGGLLLVYALEERRRKRLHPTVLQRRLWIALVLLMSNWPAGVACVFAAVEVMSRITVTVVNQGTTKIDSFVVIAPGVNKELGPIPAGKKVKTSFQVAREGSLDFTMINGGTTSGGSIDGYVTGSDGAEYGVVVTGSNAVNVSKRR